MNTHDKKSKFRNFAITDFVCDKDFYSNLKYSYLILGDEICPKTEKRHWQGFVVMKSPTTLSSMIKKLKPRHTEVCVASVLKNIKYCSKDNNLVIEDGKRPQQGHRSDIAHARAIIEETGSMRKVVDNIDSYQAVRMSEKILTYKEPKRTWKPTVYWFWGPSGSGKTFKAMTDAGDDVWMSGKNLKWWEGYDAHENVVIDDFRKDFCTFHELLRILDRYEYRVEVKGGSRQLLAKNIWITSCYPPQHVYDTREDIKQLIRRLDVIQQFGTNVDGTEVGGNTRPRLLEETHRGAFEFRDKECIHTLTDSGPCKCSK